ncbi:acetate--CoA ligase family protein [Escherichia coli]
MDVAGLSQLLVQVSDLIVDCPEIQRLDIHPLLASGSEFTALDVTLDISPFEGDNESRLAVRPYPHQLEEWVELKNGERCLFRPICQKMSHNFSNSFRESPKKIFITATLARSTNLPMKI